MRGYTFIGNIRNSGEHPESLAEIKEKFPRLCAHVNNPTEVAKRKMWRERVMKGVRHKFTIDGVYDINGCELTPRGLFLACWVHNGDMSTYNNQYMEDMKSYKPYKP